MVFKWLFVSDQTALQSETLTTTSMVQNHMANGDIYKIVSGFSLKILETQPLITMQNLIGILILKQLVGLAVTIMKFLVINGVLLKV